MLDLTAFCAWLTNKQLQLTTWTAVYQTTGIQKPANLDLLIYITLNKK